MKIETTARPLLAAMQVFLAAAALAGPPVAKVVPHELTTNGETRVDSYYWLRDDTRENSEVIDYLEAENAWFEEQMAHTVGLQETLYREFESRLDPRESSVPVRIGEYVYYQRFEPEEEYPVIARRRGSMRAPEEILLDADERSHKFDFYEVGSWAVSEDGNLFAFSEDTVGRELYTIRVRDLRTGELLADAIEGVFPGLAWGNDNRTIFYVGLDDTLRPYRVHSHALGANVAEDALLYEESDITFYLSLEKSRSREFIVVVATSTLSTETLLIDAGVAGARPVVFFARAPDHRYFVDPVHGTGWVLTNWQAENFRLMRVPLETSGDRSAWREVLPASDSVFLENFDAFDDFVAIEEVHAGSVRIRVLPAAGGEGRYVATEEDASTALLDQNPDTNSAVVRYTYSSLATPGTTWEYDTRTGERKFLKQDFAGRDYDRRQLVTERVTARARDGTGIPVTLLYRKGIRPDGTNPLFLLGYGAYGSTYYPEFGQERLSLVNRGFVFALAHIRGGQEFGRRWYEAGRTLKKKNTFHDFIDSARWLVRNGWAAKDKVAGYGRSAGGLLIGAVANMAPGTFTALVAGVPFVDVITTMEDESIPLTSYEWDEWGDPRRSPDYEYMLSYSPYDQVKARDYPHMLVTAGLWDARVQYWEPAKWVAKLRATKTGDSRLLLHTDMKVGHSGSAARYKSLRETAEEYAFLIDALGLELK
ncbi:MAG TPA: S9 family peptidase [Gammaproteobacteria bacterium]